MTDLPHKPEEHLVSGKLLCHAHGKMGELATCSGFFTYNLIMNVYGFPCSLTSSCSENPPSNPNTTAVPPTTICSPTPTAAM